MTGTYHISNDTKSLLMM